ncbi:MAG: Rsd/AlgQ family anti-sigma factor [Sedimenticola sp.]
MTATDNPDKERRGRTQDVIDNWLSERQQMLVLYCQLAGLEPFEPDKPNKQLLRDYCQVLVDYMAFGHFEVYDRIAQGEERRREVLDMAEEIYPRAVEVTEMVVAFNDKYDTSDHEQPLDHLDQDLSALGEDLAGLIEMEDRLVAAMQK